ncbi:hypothetical protein WDZ92_34415 [Nostoc sp. NIES-2111]
MTDLGADVFLSLERDAPTADKRVQYMLVHERHVAPFLPAGQPFRRREVDVADGSRIGA